VLELDTLVVVVSFLLLLLLFLLLAVNVLGPDDDCELVFMVLILVSMNERKLIHEKIHEKMEEN